MTKTIAQLWNGELEPVRYSGLNNPEIKQLEALTQRNGERLEESLDEKAKELLERYNDCIKEYMTVLNEQSFCDGFCLGTKLAAEAMTF
ncbi:MAG: DUF6809 family protein [Oscillospiraceae bacterium]